MSKHTPGAIRAAQAITGGVYGEKTLYTTSWGKKTVEGIAAIIDEETAAPDMLEVCEMLDEAMKAPAAEFMYRCAKAGDAARAALAKAMEGK